MSTQAASIGAQIQFTERDIAIRAREMQDAWLTGCTPARRGNL